MYSEAFSAGQERRAGHHGDHHGGHSAGHGRGGSPERGERRFRHGPDERGTHGHGPHGGHPGHGGRGGRGGRGARGFGRPGGWQQADLPPADDADAWLAGRLPDDWFVGEPEVTVDREEIVVVGELPPPETPESLAG